MQSSNRFFCVFLRISHSILLFCAVLVPLGVQLLSAVCPVTKVAGLLLLSAGVLSLISLTLSALYLIRNR